MTDRKFEQRIVFEHNKQYLARLHKQQLLQFSDHEKLVENARQKVYWKVKREFAELMKQLNQIK